jgi:hypothetical protein
MTAKILDFARPVNGVIVEQKRANGFINATAMAVAHGKRISDWFDNDPTIELLTALAEDLGLEINYAISRNSTIASISAAYPDLVLSKRGAPESGGGTWIHPDLAVQLAQWCNPAFAIQVSRWIREWLTTGKNPIQVDNDEEYRLWQQRYDVRILVKDSLRPELMRLVIQYAENHGISPRVLASSVHDAMNERIQGMKAKDIRVLGGLPLGVLLRDHFGASPLVDYAAINKLAKNAIEDRDTEPVQAVYEACDRYLGKGYEPRPVAILENVHKQGRRLKLAKQARLNSKPMQLDLFDNQQSA